MATIPSSFTRLQTSSPARRAQPGSPVTNVTRRLQFPSPPPALRTAGLFTLPKEPEDARLTGGTRSLERRLLALNVAGTFARARATRPVPVPQRMAAPLHPSAA